MIQHAIPYAQPSRACRCSMQACGGIIPDPDCPDHGHRKEPAMEWHEADGERCRALQPKPERKRYQCAAGHFLPANFTPPARDPHDWDDECRCKSRS